MNMNQNITKNENIEPDSVKNQENITQITENSCQKIISSESSDISPFKEPKLSDKENSGENDAGKYVTKSSPEASIIKDNEGINGTTEKNESSGIYNSQSYDPKDVHYEGDIAIYTDKNTGYQYQWDKEKDEWVIRNNTTYGFEEDTHTYTDSDGTKFFWDKEKNAWFPKIDDDFMARYQMSYGFNDQTETPKESDLKPAPVFTPEQSDKNLKLPKGEKRKASEPTWFEVDQQQNTNVYVSNLPLDIEEQEFVDFMQKCGLVMRDPITGNFKVKLYKEPGTDYLKGDALCTYIKIESVDLALNLLDGYVYKGHKVKVERAKFELKGQYDPKLKPKMRKKKEKLKLKKAQEKLFDWRPEKKIGERSKHERVVIIKNLFEPSIFDKDVSLILEFQQDLREEAGKIGEVRKVVLYDRHPEGVAQITMSSPEEADQVVAILNGRWFMKRQLVAEIWDGKTKYKIAETDSEISQRLQGWDKFLEDEVPNNSKNTEGAKIVQDVDNKSDS